MGALRILFIILLLLIGCATCPDKEIIYENTIYEVPAACKTGNCYKQQDLTRMLDCLKARDHCRESIAAARYSYDIPAEAIDAWRKACICNQEIPVYNCTNN